MAPVGSSDNRTGGASWGKLFGVFRRNRRVADDSAGDKAPPAADAADSADSADSAGTGDEAGTAAAPAARRSLLVRTATRPVTH